MTEFLFKWIVLLTPIVISTKIFSKKGKIHFIYRLSFIFLITLLVLVLVLHFFNYALFSVFIIDFSLTFAAKVFLLEFVVSLAISYLLTLPEITITERVPGKSKYKKFIQPFFYGLLLTVPFLIMISKHWTVINFGKMEWDSIIFSITTPMEGANPSFVTSFLIDVVFPGAVIFAALYSCLFMLLISKEIQLPEKYIIPVPKSLKVCTLIILLLLSYFLAFYQLNKSYPLRSLAEYLFEDSSFIEENYVNPKKVSMEFPKKKRNLIYIYLESMENTYMSKDKGGAMNDNLIPHLTELAESNHHFSQNDYFKGGYPTRATWTMGAIVAQTGGVPLKLPSISDAMYTDFVAFMPGLYNLGDVLAAQGYNECFVIGSNGDFAGRKKLYEQHGNAKVLDLYTAYDDNIVLRDYHNGWWGFEDLYLFEYAKKALLDLSSQDKPFALTMLTVDTHHIGGYVCKYCDDKYDRQYSNVIACSDRQVYNFVQWLKEQDFYDNTTIIITGDHNSMDPDYFKEIEKTGYERTVYNCFINSDAKWSGKKRGFSTMDMFPTTLAAMGVKIDGDRLGLGVNLYSDKKTLIEKYGHSELEELLIKRSKFYDDEFLK